MIVCLPFIGQVRNDCRPVCEHIIGNDSTSKLKIVFFVNDRSLMDECVYLCK